MEAIEYVRRAAEYAVGAALVLTHLALGGRSHPVLISLAPPRLFTAGGARDYRVRRRPADLS